MTIGAIKTAPSDFFFGSVDQVSFITSVRSASEILCLATFVYYYSFDFSPYTDADPQNIAVLDTGLTTAVGTGRVNNAAFLTSANKYFFSGWFEFTRNYWSILFVGSLDQANFSEWRQYYLRIPMQYQLWIELVHALHWFHSIRTDRPTIMEHNQWRHVGHTYGSDPLR